MFVFHLIFLVFLIGTTVFFTYLDLLNLRHASQKIDENESWLRNDFDVDEPGELKDYLRVKSGFSRLKSSVGLLFLLLFLYSDLLQQSIGVVQSLGFGLLTEGIVFFLSFSLLVLLFTWPFSLFETFVIEELFDFNESTLELWIKDQLKSIGLTMVFTAILAGTLLWIIGRFPDTWWLWGWGLFVGFGLLMQIIYPRLIAPLFNNFEPVEKGKLHDAVQEVFDRAGFTCSQIFTMDASRRSGHSNAYFIGFGRTKRVVLFDTLIDQLDLEQVQGVLAHELAHWKKGHVWKGILRGAIRMGIMLGVLYGLVEMDYLYRMFEVSPNLKYIGLILGAIILSPLSQWLAPLENRWSIRDEREADEFALEVMEDPEPLAEALKNMVTENLGNPFPHPLYAAFHESHPPVPDRIEHLEGDSI